MRLLIGLSLILLCISTYTDIRRREVSCSLVLLFSVLAILLRGAKGLWWMGFTELLLRFLPGMLLLLLHVLKNSWIGLGDVILILACGYMVGAEVIFMTTMTAFLSGGLCGAFMLLAKKRSVKDTLPFVPFLLVGMIVTATLLVIREAAK